MNNLSLKGKLAFLFLGLWLLSLMFLIWKLADREKNIFPYMEAVAPYASNMFLNTCMSSAKDFGDLEALALKEGMSKHQGTKGIPSEVLGSWRKKATLPSNKKWRYSPRDYELNLLAAKSTLKLERRTTLRCTLEVHNGFTTKKERIYFIPRRGSQPYSLYRNLIENDLLDRLTQMGATVETTPGQYLHPRRRRPPIEFALNGADYRLDVTPFKISLEIVPDLLPEQN